MGKLKNYLFGAVILALVVQTLAFSGAGQALADTVKPILVQVINTGDQPVPIYVPAGSSIPVSGNLTANIASGTKVGIDPASNTVKVDASGTPLPVSVPGGVTANMPAGSKVGIDSAANTVKLDQAGTPVAVSGTVNAGNLPLDSNGNLKVANQGTTNVNVGNSSLNVSGTVGIDPAANTVKLDPNGSNIQVSSQVSNTASSPLFTRDVENPARQPFVGSFGFPIQVGASSGYSGFYVPAGKRFVIEYASATANVVAGHKLHLVVRAVTNGHMNLYYLPLVSQGVFGTNEQFDASQDLHIYADPETMVRTDLIADYTLGSGDQAGTILTFSGYLVDAQ